MSLESKPGFRAWSNILPSAPPEYTIEGVLLCHRLAMLFAQPDNGKTFIAIAMALSIATGTKWAGRAVKKGISIYIACEGDYDLETRVPAWMKLHHPTNAPEGGCFGMVVNFFDDGEVVKFIELLEGIQIELLVIDTLAAAMVGGDEDRSKDIIKVTGNVRKVMKATGCAALIVHHAGWNTGREKGSISFRGDADVVIESALDDPAPDGSRVLTLSCRKIRFGPPFKEFQATLVPVLVDTPNGAFSCLAFDDVLTMDKMLDRSRETEGHAKALVKLMVEQFPEGATSKDLEGASGMTNSTFKRALAWAKNAGWFTGGGRGLRYNLNPDGCWNEKGSSKGPPLGPVHIPYRDVDRWTQPRPGPMDPSWTQVGPEPNNGVPAKEEIAAGDRNNENATKSDTKIPSNGSDVEANIRGHVDPNGPTAALMRKARAKLDSAQAKTDDAAEIEAALQDALKHLGGKKAG